LNTKKNVSFFITLLPIVLSGLIISSGITGGLFLPNYAYAHSFPVTENPAPNSIIPKGSPRPSNVTIDFSERPSPTVSTIQVLNSKNEPVNTGNFVIIGDYNREAMTTLDTKQLTDGVYTVSWQTQSLDDGHITKGSYVFGIGNVGPSAVASIVNGKTSSVKNSTYVVQSKIMNANTKIEINPFYAGFNLFKVTFTDASGKPYTKVSSAEITFNNYGANIGPIVDNLVKTGPGVFSVTGAYISQPGEWDIALAAQRVQDLDLNYEFTAKVTNAPSVSNGGSTAPAGTPISLANNIQEAPPQFDSFAWLAIALAAAVVLGSAYYYSRSKKELRKTIEMLKID
jgi:methionine-rich copper-binding protein CopC